MCFVTFRLYSAPTKRSLSSRNLHQNCFRAHKSDPYCTRMEFWRGTAVRFAKTGTWGHDTYFPLFPSGHLSDSFLQIISPFRRTIGVSKKAPGCICFNSAQGRLLPGFRRDMGTWGHDTYFPLFPSGHLSDSFLQIISPFRRTIGVSKKAPGCICFNSAQGRLLPGFRGKPGSEGYRLNLIGKPMKNLALTSNRSGICPVYTPTVPPYPPGVEFTDNSPF